jgi:hypothetical protein
MLHAHEGRYRGKLLIQQIANFLLGEGYQLVACVVAQVVGLVIRVVYRLGTPYAGLMSILSRARWLPALTPLVVRYAVIP